MKVLYKYIYINLQFFYKSSEIFTLIVCVTYATSIKQKKKKTLNAKKIINQLHYE